MKCQRPPEGWECSRQAGHDGPCAARPAKADPIPGGWGLTRLLLLIVAAATAVQEAWRWVKRQFTGRKSA